MDILAPTAVLLCFFHLVTVAGRTEVRVLVPPVVRRGSTVTLLCLHNVSSDNLYSVKWYRGNYEFYRYVPRERPPASSFPLPGLEVDMNGSSGQQVTVRVLNRHISGQFTCEVSAEEPDFSTNRDSANLTVLEIGLRKPLLIPASSVHVSGTPMQINCSAQPTVPPPHISFYIDDIKVEKTQVRTVKPGLAVLEVLRLSEFEGPLWIRCEASVSGVYHLSSASIPILEQIPLLGQSNGVPLISTLSTCLFLLHFLLIVQYKLTM